MHIETPKKTVQKSDKDIYEFLTDFKNFEQLMPDTVAKFEILDNDTFVFALKGMPEIQLRRKEQIPHSKVALGAASDRLPFSLTVDITSLSETESDVQWSFEGEFNAMMAMMVKKPIGSFLETLSDKLGSI